MNYTSFIRATLGLIVLLTTALGGCVADGGYERGGGGVSVGYGVEFYEPYGFDYGPSRPYRFGPPPRVGYDHAVRSDPHPPAYRPAPPERRVPSIPSRPRAASPSRDGHDGRDGRDAH
jgi:hypothetical protein